MHNISFNRILEGADFDDLPEEGVELTPGQFWAKLLLMDPKRRERILENMKGCSDIAMQCIREDHRGAIMTLKEIRESYGI